MGYDGSLKFDTEIDEKGFNSGVKKLGSIAKGSAGVVTSAIGATTAALGAGITMGVKYNSEMENFFADFKVMLGDAEEATQFVNDLKEMAAKTPFEMTDLASASKILLAFGSDAQSAQEQIKMLGDISLGNAEKMKTLSTAFGRIQSNGRASMEEINMMIDSGFNPLNIIAQKTGESMDELRKRVSDGGVSFEEISEAMRVATSEGGQFYKGMEEASKTLTGQLSTLKDNVNSLLGEMTKGLTDQLTNELVPSAIETVDMLTKTFEEEGIVGFTEALGNILANMVTYLAEGAPQIINMAISILSSLIKGLQDNSTQIINGVIAIITALANGIIKMLPQIAKMALDIVIQLAQSLADNAPKLVPSAVKLIVDLTKYILNNLPKIIKAAADLMIGLAQGLINSIPTVVTAIPEIIYGILRAFAIFGDEFIRVGEEIVHGLWGGIKGATGWLIDKISGFASDVVGSIKDFFGIHSPSRLMRDEVGKYMAQGIGVGFVKNIPVKQMNASMKKAIEGMQKAAYQVTADTPITAKTATKYVTSNFTNTNFDYDKFEQSQLNAMNKANERPVVLNNRQVNRALKDGGLVWT